MSNGQWSQMSELAPVLATTPAFAFLTAVLRAKWEGKEDSRTRIAIEGALCSFISTFVMAVIVVSVLALNITFPVPEKYQLSVLLVIACGTGSFVGFLGAVQFRILIRKFLHRQVSKQC